jgi:hypothetical protein
VGDEHGHEDNEGASFRQARWCWDVFVLGGMFHKITTITKYYGYCYDCGRCCENSANSSNTAVHFPQIPQFDVGGVVIGGSVSDLFSGDILASSRGTKPFFVAEQWVLGDKSAIKIVNNCHMFCVV